MELIYDANDNTVQLDELRDVDGDYQNDASSVTVDLLDQDGVSLIGSPLVSLTYVSASSGRYRGILADTLDYSTNRPAEAHVRAVGAGGEVGDWRVPCKVVIRRA